MAYKFSSLVLDNDLTVDIIKINTQNRDQQILRINNIDDIHELVELSNELRERWTVFQMNVTSSNQVNTLTVVNIVDDENMECAATLLEELQFMNTPLGDIVNIEKEHTSVIIEVGEDKNEIHKSIQLVIKLLELKEDAPSLQRKTFNVEDQMFKLKYDSALEKIVELEAKIEMLQISDHSKSIIDLKAENFELKHQMNLLRDILQNDNVFEDSEMNEINKSLNQKVENVDSDARIYKKLLVNKTDKLLQLEYEIEVLNKKNLNLKQQNSSESIKKANNNQLNPNETDKTLLLAMTETIKNQQIHLRKELERSEAELKKKEKLLEETNGNLIQRNEIVIREQNEVEKKLENMENRFKNIAAIADNSFRQNLAHTSSSNLQTPISFNSDNEDTEPEGRRRGLNLNIIKPY
ncbi:hypothetical protein CANINC_001556 [Pichia inconspicua]|uniref:Uncharacterized protein n=1 Tax=Pichia inconspicua TaxID=52247 RepID=A0A4T0X3S6_9ASCO|nr:hypothetical protein CANINC_001556 [[Candida] inconspicua]